MQVFCLLGKGELSSVTPSCYPQFYGNMVVMPSFENELLARASLEHTTHAFIIQPPANMIKSDPAGLQEDVQQGGLPRGRREGLPEKSHPINQR